MKYDIQLDIKDLLSITLCNIDVSKDEVQNIIDALNCEIDYNDICFDFFNQKEI